MKNYKFFLLLGTALLFSACTPGVTNNRVEVEEPDQQEVSELESFQDEQEDEQDISSAVRFLDYENRAIGYRIKIPTTWYWQHFIKSQIGSANPEVDNYVFISPTKPVVSVQTGLTAEIAIEVSTKDINEFADDSLTEVQGLIDGQEAVRAYGTINNDTLENYRKVEYRFTKDGRTFRITYLAPADMEENERIFEEIVRSFIFTN